MISKGKVILWFIISLTIILLVFCSVKSRIDKSDVPAIAAGSSELISRK